MTRDGDSDLARAVARAEILGERLACERLRSDRAIAYGARLLARLDALETLLREYGAHRPGCVDVDATSHGAACSCGLRAHLQDVEMWREQMIAP